MGIRKIKSANIQTSISSVVSNATSFYINYMKAKFPDNFFKDTYVSGMLTSIENERKDIIKKNKPIFIVRPNYAGENGFMETLPYWHNTLQYVFNNSEAYYDTIFKDVDKNISLYGIPDRILVDLPTKVVVSTKVYGINMLHYMKNIVEPGGHCFVNRVPFESEIPKKFIVTIFDLIFNKENKEFNKNIEAQIRELEKTLYNKEMLVINSLKEINKLSDVHDEEGLVTSEESDKILKLNLLVADTNRTIKKIKKEIDDKKKEYKEIKSLLDPDENKRNTNRQLLEEYFNNFSNVNIRSRKNLSTGNYEFVFVNNVNILMHMDSLPTLDTIRKGRTEDAATVSFEISFEFNAYSNFILEIPDSYTEPIPEDSLEPNAYKFSIFLDDNIPDHFYDDGRMYLLNKRQKFTCEFNADVDNLDFSELLNENLTEIFNSVSDKDYEDLFRIKLFIPDSSFEEDSSMSVRWKAKELVQNVDFTIDWEKKNIKMNKPLNNTSYLFTLYINNYRINIINQERMEYEKTLLLEKSPNKLLVKAEGGKKYIMSIENSSGIVRTDLCTFKTKAKGVSNAQLKSKNGKIFDLILDSEGVITTKESTKEINIIHLESLNYILSIDDDGILETIKK